MLFAERRLGEAGFGLYNYALALGFVLAQLTDLGMQLVLTREIATRVHNVLLVAAELGLPGLLLWAWLMIFLFALVAAKAVVSCQ